MFLQLPHLPYKALLSFPPPSVSASRALSSSMVRASSRSNHTPTPSSSSPLPQSVLSLPPPSPPQSTILPLRSPSPLSPHSLSPLSPSPLSTSVLLQSIACTSLRLIFLSASLLPVCFPFLLSDLIAFCDLSPRVSGEHPFFSSGSLPMMEGLFYALRSRT